MVDEIRAGTADITVLGKIVAQLTDVSLYLHKHGARWGLPFEFSVPVVYVDSNYNPTIGINDDLYSTRNSPESCASFLILKLANLLSEYTTARHSEENKFSDDHWTSTTWSKELLGGVIDTGHRALRRQNMIRRADLTSLIPLSQESWTYLHLANRDARSLVPRWAFVLLRLAVGSVRCEGSLLEASYVACRSGDLDELSVYCIEGDADVVYHTETIIEIPRSAAEEARQRLGISFGDEKEDKVEQLRAGYSATSTQRTGWVRWAQHQTPW